MTLKVIRKEAVAVLRGVMACFLAYLLWHGGLTPRVDSPLPPDTRIPNGSAASRPISWGGANWTGAAGAAGAAALGKPPPGRDPKSRARSREYLKQYADSIAFCVPLLSSL